MNWRSHVLIGAILAFLTLYLVLGTRDAFQLACSSAFGALCALAPDLDHESSKGRRIADSAAVVFAIWISYASVCGGIICLPIPGLAPMAFTGLAILGAYFVLFTIFKPRHRGITHTFAACLVFTLLLYFMAGRMLALAGLVGYASHLVADRQLKLI